MTAIRVVLEKLWFGGHLTGDDIVVLLLLATMVGSTMHLLTMLITRWGDRYLALKSLAASLLVHCVCFLGLEVFDPLQPDYVRAATETYEPVEVVTEVLVRSEDDVPLSHSGNTAAPDQPSTPEIDLARVPLPARQMSVPDQKQRVPESLDSLQTELPDVSEFAQREEPEVARPEDNAPEGPREVGAEDPGADVTTLLERNNADVYASQRERAVPREGSVEQDTPHKDRRVTAGETQRIDTQVQTEEARMDLATSATSRGVQLPSAGADRVTQRQAAPLPGTEPTETAGTETLIQPQRTLPARSLEMRLPRPERANPARDAMARAVREPSRSARTPVPLSAAYEDVRTGVMAPDDSADLHSAADLVELDTNRIQRRDQAPAAYRLRSQEYRREAVWRFGGTERSESTVERSLKWLSVQQEADGFWNADGWGAGQVKFDELDVDRDYAGKDADTGITALVTLAFLGAGYTHEEGQYAVQVDRALDWLIRQQDEEGSLAGNARYFARMYCHAMATYALAEALGMQEENALNPVLNPQLLSAAAVTTGVASASLSGMSVLPPPVMETSLAVCAYELADAQAWMMRRVNSVRLRTAVLNAVRFTIHQQHSGGGWRYKRGLSGDVSMFGWQLMSLKSAEIAGVRIPRKVREDMLKFLNKSRQGKAGGLFGYRHDEEVTAVMTAEALFCQQMLGYPRDSLRNRESVAYLMRHLPRMSEFNLYYWYYGTLAMYQYGGRSWKRWNAAVRDTLIDLQIQEGDLAGSWDPKGPWGRYGGRLYSTAVATLTLEVYYRLLPLYRINGDRSRQTSATDEVR